MTILRQHALHANLSNCQQEDLPRRLSIDYERLVIAGGLKIVPVADEFVLSARQTVQTLHSELLLRQLTAEPRSPHTRLSPTGRQFSPSPSLHHNWPSFLSLFVEGMKAKNDGGTLLLALVIHLVATPKMSLNLSARVDFILCN